MKTHTIDLDNRATTLAKDYLKKEGEILETLFEMKRKKVFPELNYSGVFEYCERRLRLSRSQSYYFQSVVEKAEVVPEIKEAVVQGEISLSQARRIVTVVTPQNHNEWISKAKELPQVELEREVAKVNPNAIPKERIKPVAPKISELRAPIDIDTEKSIGVLKDLLSRKLGRAASLSEVLAWAVAECREKNDPVRKAERRMKIVSSGNKKPVQPGRHPIPASVRHQVVLRDGQRCTYRGADGVRCTQTRWLEFHHLKEVRHGGLNTVANLRLLCSAHHHAGHADSGIQLRRSP